MPIVPQDSPQATGYNTGQAHPYDQGAHDPINIQHNPSAAPPGPMPGPSGHQHFQFGGVDRAIALGSRDFLASQNTDDRDELLYRAQRYAANETSALPVPVARQIMASFVGAVEELIARRPRKRQASAPVTAYEDFPDEFMHITAVIEPDGTTISPDWGVANGGMHVDDPDNIASQIGRMTF
jgi:hypothetical protein